LDDALSLLKTSSSGDIWLIRRRPARERPVYSNVKRRRNQIVAVALFDGSLIDQISGLLLMMGWIISLGVGVALHRQQWALYIHGCT
jgi:hypothetical protein